MSSMVDTQSGSSESRTAIVQVEADVYAVPVAVLERHRIVSERRTEMAAALRDGAEKGEGPAEAPLYEVSPETLAPYRLVGEKREAVEAERGRGEASDDAQGFVKIAPGQPKGEPINGYTGYAHSTHFGRFVNQSRGLFSGEMVYIGVFPMHQEPSSSGAYPGLR